MIATTLPMAANKRTYRTVHPRGPVHQAITHALSTWAAAGHLWKMALVVWLVSAGHSAAATNSMLALRYPLGLPRHIGSGMSFSMGGTGAGVYNDHNLLLSNPANLGHIGKTVLSSMATLDYTNIADTEHDRDTEHFTFVPHQISFGFPMGSVGALALSLNQRYDVGVRYRDRDHRSYGDTYATVDSVELAFARDGGLTSWQIGWGRKIGKWAHVGAAYTRAYFSIRQAAVKRVYVPSSNTLSNIRDNALTDTTDVLFRGNGFKAGIQVPIDKLVLGCYGEYFFESTARSATATYDGRGTPAMDRRDFELQLPPSITGGASYRFSPQWFAAVDVGATLWDHYSSDRTLLSAEVRNAFSVSLGAQYIVAPNQLAPKYWETIQYRAGTRYTQLPAEGASEMALTLGTGLPLAAGGGLVDLAVEIGRRHDSNYDDLKENFVKFAIGVNGGRKWTKSSEGSY